MAKFRVTEAQPGLGLEKGDVVQVADANIGIWAARPWTKRVGPEAAVKGPKENAAQRTGKIEVRHKGGGWYAVLDDGDEVESVRGREEAEELAREMEA